MEKSFKEPLVTLKHGNAPIEVMEEMMAQKGRSGLVGEDVLMDFGELDDYAEIYGDMDDL